MKAPNKWPEKLHSAIVSVKMKKQLTPGKISGRIEGRKKNLFKKIFVRMPARGQNIPEELFRKTRIIE